MCDDDVLQGVFSLSSCMTSRRLHSMRQHVRCTCHCQLCGIIVSIGHGKHCWTSGSTQSAARKKARVAAASDRGPAKASCLMFPAVRSTQSGTCTVCSAPSRVATEVHACSVSGRTGAVTTEKVRQKKKKTGMIECSTERCGSAGPSCHQQQDWKFWWIRSC